MNKRRARRPYVRQRSSQRADAPRPNAIDAAISGDVISNSSRLAAAQGEARPAVDALEPRQMLFALTVASGQPGNFFLDGVEYGTVSSVFGYVLPYILPSEPLEDDGDDGEPEVRAEDFSEFDAALGTQSIASGTVFDESFLRVRHNLNNNANIFVNPALNDPDLNVTFSQIGDEVSLSFLDGDNSTQVLAVTEMSASLSGLDTQDSVVELRLRGEIVGLFDTSAEIGSLSSTGTGSGRFTFTIGGSAFDEVIIRRSGDSGGATNNFTIDDVQISLNTNQFGDVLDGNIFATTFTFTAPVGATVEILDLYGRQMIQTLALGQPANSDIYLVDVNGDGIPDFNDGIGRINFSGTDGNSSFTMLGGTIEEETQGELTVFVFELLDDLDGLTDDMLDAGFAHIAFVEEDGTAVFEGLANGIGVVVGSPLVRDLGAYNPGEPVSPSIINDLQTDSQIFNRADQGFFITDGSNMGSVNLQGALYGSSSFDGFVERFGVTALYGSLTVEGDLGQLIVATEAGGWRFDGDFAGDRVARDLYQTGSQIVVGRTLGSYHVGGRTVADITVLGDLTEQSARAPRDVTTYVELEQPYGIQTDADPIQTNFNFILNASANQLPNTYFFGNTLFRNDDLLSAEYVGNISTSVTITGNLGLGSPIHTGEDNVDVYAFNVDGLNPVIFEGDTSSLNYRIMNNDGETLAALQGGRDFIEFVPPEVGVYYLVVGDAVNGDSVGDTFLTTGTSYSIVITGMAPVAFGAFHSGGGAVTRAGITGFDEVGFSVSVLAGSLGAIQYGGGFVGGDGAVASTLDFIKADGNVDEDDALRWAGGSFNIAGSLLSISTGGDIAGNNGFWDVDIIIGGNFGSLTTGLSTLVDGGPAVFDGVHGDVNGLNLVVGGSLSRIDIRGGVGFDHISGTPTRISDTGSALALFVGQDGQGPASIGVINIDGLVGGGEISITGPDETTVDAIIISRQLGFNTTGADPRGEQLGILGSGEDGDSFIFNVGAGSNIRYFSSPRVDSGSGVDPFLAIPTGGGVLELVDDGGGRVQIRIIPGSDTGGTDFGVVRYLPVSGSEGGVIAQIDVDLSGGGQLEIIGLGEPEDVISIGTILIRNATATSAVTVRGQAEVDVWLINQVSGERMAAIRNTTDHGDFVAIDVTGVSVVSVGTGSLGRTETSDWAPRLIGPRLGAQAGVNATVGGALGISPAAVGPAWNGTVYAALNRVNPGGAGAGDDVGLPMNPYLNGLVARSGNVDRVTAGGAIGDVILQGAGGVANGQLREVRANFDGVTAPGEFDGIVGLIYADVIGTVNVGDGLVGTQFSPILTSGIFASDDIVRIEATRPGADLSGAIYAANVLNGTLFATSPTDATGTLLAREGISLITMTSGGDFVDLFIGVADMHNFWQTNATTINEAFFTTGVVWEVVSSSGNFFRSTIQAIDLGSGAGSGKIGLSLRDGFYDASSIQLTGTMHLVSATGFRNSTLLGTAREFAPSTINAQTLREVRTNGNDGEMRDLTISVVQNIAERIFAGSITRSTINAANNIQLIQVNEDLRSTSIEGGTLARLTVGDTVVSSEITLAGPLVEMTVTGAIVSSVISVEGPDGRIDRIRAAEIADSVIFSSGRIALVETTEGDFEATVQTITDRGFVDRLVAERDLVLDANISAGLGRLEAGRHIGRFGDPSVIEVRSDIASVTAGGHLYADILSGGTISGLVRIGADGPNFNLPTMRFASSGSIEAAGRINSVEIDGDYAGTITSNSGGIFQVQLNQGSLLQGAGVFAFDGDVAIVRIDEGNLYGDIYADYHIYLVEVIADDAGIYGDIGVNNNPLPGTGIDPADVAAAGGLNRFVTEGGFRTILPPGTANTTGLDGASIQAGRNIGRVVTTGGSVFESSIIAGAGIGFIEINGSFGVDPATTATLGGRLIRGNTIAAGDSIFEIAVTGTIGETFILSGFTGFGADGVLGGTGADADTGKMGWIETITSNSFRNVIVSAGVSAGADGLYNNADDLIRPGASFVENISTNNVINSSVYSDAFGSFSVGAGAFDLAGSNDYLFNGGVTDLLFEDTFGIGIPLAGALGGGFADITGAGGATFDYGGVTGSIEVSGDGSFFFDEVGRTIVFQNTNFTSRIVITLDTGVTLNDFSILGVDDASIGLIEVNANLDGNSWIFVDAYAREIATQAIGGDGGVLIGAQATDVTTGALGAPVFNAGDVSRLTINGNVGSTVFDRGSATRAADGLTGGLDLLAVGTLNITGDLRARVNVERNAVRVNIDGGMDNALFRVGGASLQLSVGNLFTVGPNGATFSVRESRISINDFLTTLETDGDVFDTSILFGGDLGSDATFSDDDRVTAGSAGTVRIGGGFLESDLIAGAVRGEDGFFGTGDDRRTKGLANLGTVTIGQNELGSDFNSESYRISATGSIAGVTVAGQTLTTGTPRGNFEIENPGARPLAIRVTDLRVVEASRTYTAQITFNQAMDESSFADALSVINIRQDVGDITLTNGDDYTISYDADTFTMLIRFSKSVTGASLTDAAAGEPAPGIYRFVLDQETLRAAAVRARLDGDGDLAVETNDDFSFDDIVGDAGDRTSSDTRIASDGREINFFGAVNLDTILDNNYTPDGVPDANTPFVLRGVIGDHPDNGANGFRFVNDIDLYEITLQAGQILRLNGPFGAPFNAGILLLNDAGEIMGSDEQEVTALPSTSPADEFLGLSQSYLVRETGTFYILIGNNINYLPGDDVPNFDASENDIGPYQVTLELFDDGDTGFAANTDAGDGDAIVNAPTASSFATPDSVITIGAYTFTLAADGSVIGSTADGKITSVRAPDGTLTSTVTSAIGADLAAGIPAEIAPDVDVFHLNNRNTINQGTRLRVTVKLADLGSNLGGGLNETFGSFDGDAVFGVFDTTNATNITDAELLFSPGAFLPIADPDAGTLAIGDNATYGYDANGDFFIEFTTPRGTPRSYAVYLQGVLNSAYQIEVVQSVFGASFDLNYQNFLIETDGGFVDWLEAGGLTTNLTGFDPAVNGFVGELDDGRTVEQFIIDFLVGNDSLGINGSLNDLFGAAGVDVRISMNPNDFEFENFSTVFLTSSTDPTTSTFDFLGLTGATALSFTNPYGVSEGSDPFNARDDDEAIVFAPALGNLRYTPSTEDLTDYARSLTAAVGRRMAELLGLRITDGPGVDSEITNEGSVFAPLNGVTGFSFTDNDVRLSSRFDSISNTNFYLGNQNSDSLLDDLLAQTTP